MLRENLTALLLLYIRPVGAISRILDHGRLWFAILAAVGVSLVLHTGLTGVRVEGTNLAHAFANWIGFSSLAPLLAIALVFVPSVIFIRAVSGFGSFSVLMRSDYLSLLLCVLMTWAAAYLPFATLAFLLFGPVLLIPANLYFTVLAAFGIRTLFGIGFGPAIGLALLGCVAAIGGIALSDFAGPMKYYLMSPFLLYYAYSMFGSDVRSLGDGLRSRQHLRQQMEVATTNPRDADAHYQLGLIYQQRRQYTEAIARFQKAIEIDPSEADAQFQLGRIAREQGRFDDAIRFLKTAAGLNEKLSSGEVWRELGAAYFRASRLEEAAAALAKYTERRSYDPEGLYWYGKTLASLGKSAQAREVFGQCVEAVDTMPKHRRAEVRKWKGLARTELKTVATSR
jgi:tetratricopeptide (TPR) repeat protein